jgi:hypothetical protein
VNGDGQPDLIYTVASCGTACLAEVRIITWDAAAGEYVRIDAPGAFIAEGEVRIEESAGGCGGCGQAVGADRRRERHPGRRHRDAAHAEDLAHPRRRALPPHHLEL